MRRAPRQPPPARLVVAGLAAALASALPAAAPALPFPASLGDYSLGAGPALVVGSGELGGGVTAEANLLFGLYSIGARGRAAAPAAASAVGFEVAFAGLVGLGASAQRDGPSIDGFLALPVPVGVDPWFLSLGWRPSFLLDGGVRHEVSLQIKWSSLLVADD
ncbi:MAG TPA: hypothetical protein VN033_14670 [Vulgatibacter sp.]|nr:hypothetical protein [Vulgatibacter sp.]